MVQMVVAPFFYSPVQEHNSIMLPFHAFQSPNPPFVFSMWPVSPLEKSQRVVGSGLGKDGNVIHRCSGWNKKRLGCGDSVCVWAGLLLAGHSLSQNPKICMPSSIAILPLFTTIGRR